MDRNGTAPSKLWKDILEGLSPGQLRVFLASEMRGDVPMQRRFLSMFGRRGTTSRAEFRAEIEAAYAQIVDTGQYRAELDFDDFFGAAKASAGSGDHDEALWMYQEISEAISDHMEDVDDSYGHYGTHHGLALDGMANCTKGLNHEQKRPHMSYMYDMILSDNYGLDANYADSLAEMCTDEQDRRYLRELRLHETHIHSRARAALDGAYGSRRRIA